MFNRPFAYNCYWAALAACPVIGCIRFLLGARFPVPSGLGAQSDRTDDLNRAPTALGRRELRDMFFDS